MFNFHNCFGELLLERVVILSVPIHFACNQNKVKKVFSQKESYVLFDRVLPPKATAQVFEENQSSLQCIWCWIFNEEKICSLFSLTFAKQVNHKTCVKCIINFNFHLNFFFFRYYYYYYYWKKSFYYLL